MRHRHVAEHYTAYLEDALPERLRQQVARHLDDCPRCAAELEALRATVAALREWSELPVPPEFTVGVRARLERRPRRRPFFAVPLATAGALAAATAVMLLLFWRPTPPMAPSGESFALRRAAPPVVDEKRSRAGNKLEGKHLPAPAPTPPTTLPFTGDSVTDPFAGGDAARPASPPPPPPRLTPKAFMGNDSPRNAPGKEIDAPLKSKAPTAREPETPDREHAVADHLSRDASKPANNEAGGKPDFNTDTDKTAGVTSASPYGETVAGARLEVSNGATAPRYEAQSAGRAAPQNASRTSPAPPDTTIALHPSTATAARSQKDDSSVMSNSTVSRTQTAGKPSFSGALKAAPGAAIAESMSVTSSRLDIRVVSPPGAPGTQVDFRAGEAAPLTVTVQTVYPAQVADRRFNIAAASSAMTLTLPDEPDGAVLKLIACGDGDDDVVYLIVPGRGPRRSTVTLHLADQPLYRILLALANTGSTLVRCPGALAEQTHVSLTVADVPVLDALATLLKPRGYQPLLAERMLWILPLPANANR